MKEDLLFLIKTKDEANRFFEFADMVVEKTYGTKKFDRSVIDKCAEEILSKEEDRTKPLWLEKICEQISKDISPESAKADLEGFATLVSLAELVKMEISFEPSQDFIDEIYKVIKESGFKSFLLDVEINPRLKGGAKFFVGGKYMNLTLHAIVSKYLRIKDVINRYL